LSIGLDGRLTGSSIGLASARELSSRLEKTSHFVAFSSRPSLNRPLLVQLPHPLRPRHNNVPADRICAAASIGTQQPAEDGSAEPSARLRLDQGEGLAVVVQPVKTAPLSWNRVR
jgi:hypothetical protein